MNEICILQTAVSHNTEICRHTLSVTDDRNLLFLVLNSIPWCTYTTVCSQKDILWVSILSVSLAPLHKCQSHWPRRYLSILFLSVSMSVCFQVRLAFELLGLEQKTLPMWASVLPSWTDGRRGTHSLTSSCLLQHECVLPWNLFLHHGSMSP